MNYSPSLSLIKLSIKNINSIPAIKVFLETIKEDLTITRRESTNDQGFYFLKNGLMMQHYKDNLILFFSENKHFHLRKTLSEELDKLLPNEIKDIKLSHISEESYLGVLWNANATSDISHNTSFVSYYQFNTAEKQFSNMNGLGANNFSQNTDELKNRKSLETIGILPIRFDKNFFMNCITIGGNTDKNHIHRSIDFNIFLQNSIVSFFFIFLFLKFI